MRFNLLDRIDDVEPGRLLRASKNLTLGEEYLADHFPSFPILPGVLMLEAMVQAGAWLMRLSGGFSPPVIVLREARAVRYGSVVRPGDELRVEVELLGAEGDEAAFKGTGRVGDRNAVVGRFVLRRVSLARLAPGLAATEEEIARLLEGRLPALMECGRGI